jgi:hypothetical protein
VERCASHLGKIIDTMSELVNELLLRSLNVLV